MPNALTYNLVLPRDANTHNLCSGLKPQQQGIEL
jgi:hypothetical protein